MTTTSRARKPMPSVDPTGTTSAVDALAASDAEVERIVRVSPTELAIGPNVRKQLDPTSYKELVASVADIGVLTAIEAYLAEDGTLTVVDGASRTNAAVDAGASSVPVRVIPKPEGADLTERQLVVNTARIAMTRADQVAAVQQLAFDFKLPAAKIAKRTGIRASEVKHALTVANAPAALAGLDDSKFSLEFLAKLADSGLTEDEARPVLEARWNPEATLESAIAAKTLRTAIQSETDKLRAAGKTIAKEPPTDAYGSPTKGVKAAWLKDLVDPKTKKPIVEAAHESTCEGHAYYVGPVRGYRPTEAEATPVCVDPAKYGHKAPAARAASNLTAEERDEKKLKTRLNKAWDAVSETRLTWIRDNIFSRTKLPENWQTMVARDLAGEHEKYEPHFGYGGQPVILNKILSLGVPTTTSDHTGVELVDGNVVGEKFWARLVTRPDHCILALAIQRHESALRTRGAWERVDVWYLNWLTDHGYVLTEEEATILERHQKITARRAESLAAAANSVPTDVEEEADE